MDFAPSRRRFRVSFRPAMLWLGGMLATLPMAGAAQTPSRNLMPDGSHDMYLGIGAIHRPYYEGARRQRLEPWPTIQMQVSNGLFVSGLSAGWHALTHPVWEAGPLLHIEPGRNHSGTGLALNIGDGGINNNTVGPSPGNPGNAGNAGNRLLGLNDVPTRLLGGGFVNLALSQNWRVSQTVLYGAGQDRRGLRATSDVQYRFSFGPHHLALGAGLLWGNASYNQTWFGVEPVEARRSALLPYQADSGIKDVHGELRWNLALSPHSLLTSSAKLTRLRGSAAASPLVERKTGTTLTVALAYRF